MIRRPPRSTRTDTLLPLHDALPISFIPTQSGDALVTLSSGVYRLDLESPGLEPRLTLLCMADPTPGNRANEARCDAQRSEEHTSELPSLMRISYAVFCLNKKPHTTNHTTSNSQIYHEQKHMT